MWQINCSPPPTLLNFLCILEFIRNHKGYMILKLEFMQTAYTNKYFSRASTPKSTSAPDPTIRKPDMLRVLAGTRSILSLLCSRVHMAHLSLHITGLSQGQANKDDHSEWLVWMAALIDSVQAMGWQQHMCWWQPLFVDGLWHHTIPLTVHLSGPK